MGSSGTAILALHEANSAPRTCGANDLPRARISDLLSHLAGGRAAELARAFPYPHRDLLAAPRGRIHAAAMRLARRPDDHTGARAPIHDPRWRPDAVLDGSEYLTAALLSKLPLPVWNQTAYQHFIQLLDTPSGRNIVRQSATLDPNTVMIAATLQPSVRRARVVNALASISEAILFNEYVDYIEDVFARHSRAFHSRLKRVAERQALWQAVAKTLQAPLQPYPSFNITLPANYRYVTDTAELKQLARRFKNCLASFDRHVQFGQIDFLLRLTQPSLIIQIAPRIGGGGFFDEVRGINNTPPTRSALADITAELGSVGIVPGSIPYHAPILNPPLALAKMLANFASGDASREMEKTIRFALQDIESGAARSATRWSLPRLGHLRHAYDPTDLPFDE
jgi:hypothetical protein